MFYYLTFDIGTSSLKTEIFDSEGRRKADAAFPYKTHFPEVGFSEQDAEDWWDAAVKGTSSCFEQFQEKEGFLPEIACIGVDGQSWSAVPIDGEGKSIRRVPIWTDRRASELCRKNTERIGAERIFKTAVNALHPGYTLPKILWIKENEPEIYAKTRYFLSCNGYLVFRLTGECCTDYSQGYGIHSYNLEKKAYDDELSEAFGFESSKIPEFCESSEIVGGLIKDAASALGLEPGIPVVAGGLDAASSTLGAGVYKAGMCQEQGGQAGGMSLCESEAAGDPALIFGRHVLPGLYLLQGGTVGGGASMNWLASILYHYSGKEADFKNLDEDAENIAPGSEGLIFLPYMSGERSPIWDDAAQGVFFGLGFGKTPAHLVRSVLEGVAFSLRHNLDQAKKAGQEASELIATGGSAKSRLWLQIKADVTGKKMLVPEDHSAAGRGTAMLCALALKQYKDVCDLSRSWVRFKSEIIPSEKNTAIYKKYYERYLELYPLLKEEMRKIYEISRS